MGAFIPLMLAARQAQQDFLDEKRKLDKAFDDLHQMMTEARQKPARPATGGSAVVNDAALKNGL